MSEKVFVFKTTNQVGNGLYPMVACFISKDVHVPFVMLAHSENEYLKNVGEPIKCDGSCLHPHGSLEDWSKERHDSSYAVDPIIKKANSFAKQFIEGGRIMAKVIFSEEERGERFWTPVEKKLFIATGLTFFLISVSFFLSAFGVFSTFPVFVFFLHCFGFGGCIALGIYTCCIMLTALLFYYWGYKQKNG